MAQDLPGYLDLIKRSRPDDLLVVSRELDPAYEITALVVKLEREARRRPVVICERVKGTSFPVLTNLHGMGDIAAAPVAKMYASVVLSRKFPLILRVAARQFMGGAQGAVGDAAVYLPLPGSSKSFVMFAGPSITLATRHYLQTVYGVTPQQSLASGHPVYEISHAGTSNAGVGFSATKFIGKHLLLNLDMAISQIRGSPAYSPIVEERTQRVLALSFDYHWE